MGRVARVVKAPALAILLIAPFFGETFSTATAPLDLLLPWRLPIVVGLYGCGALICREIARRHRFGLLGLCLLGAAYGVYEEGLIDRFWFDPTFWTDTKVGDYSEVWHTNLLLATHLTAFHTAISICASILVVERLFPSHRDRAWAGRRGLPVAAVAFLILVPLGSADFYVPPIPVLIAAGALCALLVVCAFLVPRRPPSAEAARRRGLAWIAFFAATTHFVLVYAIPSTNLPWPIGTLISLLPIAIAILLVRRYASGGLHGRDANRVLTGMIAFFLLFDVVIGLGGRYDLSLGAIATAFALRRLRTSSPAS
ncbi:hypothetical protein GCM10009554_11520 [Kribbella koreensis]|uniref:Uncharacterized protein n=1 Tax=Kribbella koreensis TaxID=57909 RepID=A0ABP4A0R3_9ACTN